MEKKEPNGPRCDYRNSDCVNDGKTIDGVWVCNNHLRKPNSPLSWEEAVDTKCEEYGFRVPYDGSNNFYDEEVIYHFKKGADWSKEFFASRVQALEEENKKLKFECDSNVAITGALNQAVEERDEKISDLTILYNDAKSFLEKEREENKRLQDELAAYRVTSKAQSDSYIELQERLSAADHVVYTLSPDQRPNWLRLPHNTGLAIIKYLELSEKYNSLKK